MTPLRTSVCTAAVALSLVAQGYGQATEAAPGKSVAEKPAAAKPAEQPEVGKPAEKPAPGKPDALPASPRILGWKEWVWIAKPELILRAKLDTGARTCSIHATNIEALELDGKKWVKFTISDPSDEKGNRLRHKAEVTRVAKVKNDRGGLDERYVVVLPFQIGGERMEGEFTLNDRGEMMCGVLIGRNILAKLGAVDSSRKSLLEKPKAPPKPRKAKKRKKRRSTG